MKAEKTAKTAITLVAIGLALYVVVAGVSTLADRWEMPWLALDPWVRWVIIFGILGLIAWVMDRA